LRRDKAAETASPKLCFVPKAVKFLRDAHFLGKEGSQPAASIRWSAPAATLQMRWPNTHTL
jgi:hypothetical protein